MKKYLFRFVSAVFHLAAGAVIYYFWEPVVSWYWHYRPILGIDFYNTVSYVGSLARHFAFRFNGWKYDWWGGFPRAHDLYPTLHFYFILPLIKFFGVVQAVQIYALAACFLFLFFSYLLFAEIAKDRILALFLTVAYSFSMAVYGPLVLGGSLPYFASQFFLPLVLWALVKYLNKGDRGDKGDRGEEGRDRRWFYLSSLFLGISFLGHLQVGFSFIVPISFLLILFYPLEDEKYFSAKRFQRLFAYFLPSAVVGYPQLAMFTGFTPRAILANIPRVLRIVLGKFFPQGGEALPGVVSTSSPEAIAAIAEFQKGELRGIFIETNPIFFIFLIAGAIILLLSLVIKLVFRVSHKQNLSQPLSGMFRVWIFALPALWIIFYIYLYAYGIGLFHGGWYRVFWPLPLGLGMLISFIWRDFWQSVKERLGRFGRQSVVSRLFSVVPGALVLVPGLVLLSRHSAREMITKIETPHYRQQSSAFPDSLGAEIKKEELEKLKKRLTPSWLDPNETNYRLYETDQRVNIWWNGFFDMPLVKGYLDSPSGDSSGGFYWTSIALSQTSGRDALVADWEVPEEMAYSNALYLIDWYSIRYAEAEHEPSDSFNPPASYLAAGDIFARKEKIIVPGLAQLYMIDDGQAIGWHPDKDEYLTYYEIKEKLVSPIAHTTNASTIGVIGAVDGYRTIIRSLAAVNLNSRRVIPLQLGRLIDEVSFEDLENMDMVILYAYDYRSHDKAWGKLEQYVRQGGKVLIETGSEVKQTDSVNLPAKYPKELPGIFPVKMTRQGEMGRQWSLSGEEIDGVDYQAFGPPILDNDPWLFSIPNSSEDLKQGARVILANQRTPLVASWSYGKGEVVWSGINLPYHIISHKNIPEAKFFQHLIANFITIEPVDYSGYAAERRLPSAATILGNNAKGVFFREQDFPGWQAKIKSKVKSEKLKVYPAGPTYPGFMYVVVPKEMRDSDFEVTFTFRGELWGYFWQFLSVMTMIFLFDKIIFNSRLLAPWTKIVSAPLMKRVGGWWEKEEY